MAFETLYSRQVLETNICTDSYDLVEHFASLDHILTFTDKC
jgi:hypothetical protein